MSEPNSSISPETQSNEQQDEMKHVEDMVDETKNEDLIENKNDDLIDKRYGVNEFPNSIGTFGVIQNTFSSSHSYSLQSDKPFKWTVSSNRFNKSELAAFLRYVEKCNITDEWAEKPDTLKMHGAWSPPHRVNLDSKSRKLANIPETATKFAWFYPGKGIPIDVLENHPNIKVVEKWKTNPNIMSLIIGGYSYFNDKNQLLLENTLVPNCENGLKFGAAQKWKHQFGEKLFKQERFHKITFSHMINRGALYFGWIFPFEELYDNQGNSWIVSKYGAFVYLWHEPEDMNDEGDKWKYDRYFEVVPSTDNVIDDTSKDEMNDVEGGNYDAEGSKITDL